MDCQMAPNGSGCGGEEAAYESAMDAKMGREEKREFGRSANYRDYPLCFCPIYLSRVRPLFDHSPPKLSKSTAAPPMRFFATPV